MSLTNIQDFMNIDIFMEICERLNAMYDQKAIASLSMAMPNFGKIALKTISKYSSLIKLEILLLTTRRPACQIITKKKCILYSNIKSRDLYELLYLSRYCHQPYTVDIVKMKLLF